MAIRSRYTGIQQDPQLENIKSGVESRLRARVRRDRVFSALAGLVLCAPTIGDLAYSTLESGHTTIQSPFARSDQSRAPIP